MSIRYKDFSNDKTFRGFNSLIIELSKLGLLETNLEYSDGPFTTIGSKQLKAIDVERAIPVLSEIWSCDLKSTKRQIVNNLFQLHNENGKMIF